MSECTHEWKVTGYCEWKSTVFNGMVRQEINECQKCGEKVESEIWKLKNDNSEVVGTGT